MAIDEKLQNSVAALTGDDPLASLATTGLISGAKGLYRGASWLGQKLNLNSSVDNIGSDDMYIDLPERSQRDTGSEDGFSGSQENWTWLKDVLSNIADDISSIKTHLIEQDKDIDQQADFEKLRLIEDEFEYTQKQKTAPMLEKRQEESSKSNWLLFLLPLGLMLAGALKELLKSFPQIEDTISKFSNDTEDFLKSLPGIPDDFTTLPNPTKVLRGAKTGAPGTQSITTGGSKNAAVLPKTPMQARRERMRRLTDRVDARERLKRIKASRDVRLTSTKNLDDVKSPRNITKTGGRLKSVAKVGGALVAPITAGLSAWERANEGQSTSQIAVGVGSELVGALGAGALGAKAGAMAGLAFGPGAVIASPVLAATGGLIGSYLGSKYSGEIADSFYGEENSETKISEKETQMPVTGLIADLQKPVEQMQQSNREVTDSQSDLYKANIELKSSIDLFNEKLNSQNTGRSRQTTINDRTSASRSLAMSSETLDGASLLRVKESDGQTRLMNEYNFRGQAFEGGDTHEATIAMARLFQSTLGKRLNRFTAFNDAHHHTDSRAGNSKHKHGLALDFTIQGGKKEAAEATAMLRALLNQNNLPGSIKDEYNFPSGHATRPHIHAQFNSRAEANKFLELMRKKQIEIEKNRNSEKVKSTVADDRSLDRPQQVVAAQPMPIVQSTGGVSSSAAPEAPAANTPRTDIPLSLTMSMR